MAEEDTVASISRRFGVADYVVFALCLLVSAAIGMCILLMDVCVWLRLESDM